MTNINLSDTNLTTTPNTRFTAMLERRNSIEHLNNYQLISGRRNSIDHLLLTSSSVILFGFGCRLTVIKSQHNLSRFWREQQAVDVACNNIGHFKN